MQNTNISSQTTNQQDQPIYIDREDGVVVIEGLITDAIYQNNMDDLRDIVDTLDKLLRTRKTALEQENPALLERQQKNLARARWHILPRLSTKVLEDLFRHHFEYFFEYTVKEVTEGLRTVFLAEADYDVRDLVKQQLRDALSQSQVHIGEANIRVTGVLVEPTLSNWLRDWRDFLGDRKPDSLMIVEYLNANENIRVLPAVVREKMLSVLKLYIFLLKSSQTPEGLEDRVVVADPYTGTYKTLNYGQLEESGVPVPEDALKQLRNDYLLDENGKPLPLAERVKRLPQFDEMVKGIKAQQGQQKAGESFPRAPITPKISPQPVPTPAPLPPVMPTVAFAPKPAVMPTPTPAPVSMPKVMPQVMPLPKLSVATPVAPQPKPPEQKRDPRMMAEQVLGEHKILFPSLDLEKRFLTILASYFSGIRDRAETREAFVRVPQEGGVNISADQADAILLTAEAVRDGKQTLSKILPRVKPAQAPVFKPRLADVTKIVETQKSKEQVRPAEVEDILSTVNPLFDSQQVAQPTASFRSIGALNRPQKKVMQDITPSSAVGPRMPQVMGPLDELRAFSLEEFHRLSPDPVEAAKHVYDKVQLLELESVDKKAQGIRAWQQSPINQLYISMGNECLEKSVAVGDIIMQRNAAKKPTLTKEEFSAVSDLNRRLRF